MKNLAGKVSHLLIAGVLVMSGCGGGKGDPGAAGTTGHNGTDGNNGVIGDAGPQGIPGSNGANGDAGINGANGDAGASTALLSLTITNSLTTTAVSGATVALTPLVPMMFAPTGSSGTTSATLPSGDYTLSVSAAGFTTATRDVELVSGKPEPLTIKLVPATNVYVNAGNDVTGQAPDATVSLSGTATPLDNSNVLTTTWSQTGGPTASITDGDTLNPTVTLPDASAYKTALIQALTAPVPVAASLDVTSPTSFPVRLDVVGINPYSITEASTVVLTLTVTTSSGTYTSTVNVTANSPNLPFQVTTGIRNVPVGIPQLLQAGPLPAGITAYSWTVDASGASGSNATISDPTNQYPVFTPDVGGTYVLTEASTSTAATPATITLIAGNWAGAITGLNATDGLPDAANCTNCHSATGIANASADKFPAWRATGHAQIFTEESRHSGHDLDRNGLCQLPYGRLQHDGHQWGFRRRRSDSQLGATSRRR